MFSCSGLGEKSVERVVSGSDGFVRRHLQRKKFNKLPAEDDHSSRAVSAHLAIGLDAVLEAVELPAGVTNLGSSLAHVNRDTLSLNNDNINEMEM